MVTEERLKHGLVVARKMTKSGDLQTRYGIDSIEYINANKMANKLKLNKNNEQKI